uniref:Uncharacterized protein n=1 Tax=Romanomermis culicivorax TaxID=13658 RepID=A0A915HXB6_ROMCU
MLSLLTSAVMTCEVITALQQVIKQKKRPYRNATRSNNIFQLYTAFSSGPCLSLVIHLLSVLQDYQNSPENTLCVLPNILEEKM